MKDSDILKQAKRELHKVSGICGAISRAADTLPTTNNYAELHLKGASLKRWVRSMLGGQTWITGWLLEHKHTSKDTPGYCDAQFWAKFTKHDKRGLIG